MRLPTKNITTLGIMASIGILLGYIESFISLPIRVPGIKLGLSNCITVLVLYLFGPIEAFVVLLVRVLLSGFLFGSGFSIIYSLVGGLFSFFIMFLLYKSDKISIIGLSVLGGVSHNFAQLLLATIVVRSMDALYYLPILIISGIIAGLIVGIVSINLYKRLFKLLRGNTI